MSLDKLLLNRSGYFFVLHRPLTRTVVNKVFDQLVPSGRRAKIRLARVQRTVDGNLVLCSLLLFELTQEPGFLRGTTYKDKKHGFVLLVEVSGYLLILKRNAPNIENRLSDYVVMAGYDALTKAYVGPSTTFQRASFRYMSTSNYLLRQKSVEAEDLEGALSSLGLSRAIPRAATHSSVDGVHTVHPGTSLLSRRGEKKAVNDLIRWAIATCTELDRTDPRDSFLDRCARPARFEELGTAVTPAGILLNFEPVYSGILTGALGGPYEDSGGTRDMPEGTFRNTILPFSKPLELQVADGNTKIVDDAGKELGVILRNKKTYSVRVPALKSVFFRDESGDVASLQSITNLDRDFLIVFSDWRYAFFQGRLYRDGGLAEAAKSIAATCHSKASMEHAASEKGSLTWDSTEFPADSLFGIIEQDIVDPSWLCACDDQGDEWADYVAMSPEDSPPAILFLHAKHGDPTSGGTPLQDVVAQALKNAGRVTCPEIEFKKKVAKWDDSFRVDGVQTRIRRYRRGDSSSWESRHAQVQTSPHTVRSVGIVVSALSKSALTSAARRLGTGEVLPYFTVQLFWLLSSFAGGCLEVGAQPHIYCRP